MDYPLVWMTPRPYDISSNGARIAWSSGEKLRDVARIHIRLIKLKYFSSNPLTNNQSIKESEWRITNKLDI